MNQFGLVQAVDRFSQRVIVAVATATDGRLDTCLGQTFAVSNADVLCPSIGVVYQSPVVAGLASIQRLFKRIQNKVRGHLTRQPTMRRANTSITNATYSQPCQVET
jgi:hypothetical protein